MIVKSRPRKTRSFSQLIDYLLDNKGRGLGEKPLIYTHNVRGDTPVEWTKSLESNEPIRIRSNATRVLHEIVSFHVNDKERIDTGKLEVLAKEYIKKRSVAGRFVAIGHVDDAHVHIHICGSPWDMNGNSLRISKKKFKELKAEYQDFQRVQFPELLHSVVDHDGSQNVKSISKNAYQRNKVALLELIHSFITRSRDRNGLVELLRKQGLEIYKRSGRQTGVIYKGKKYRFKTLGIDLNNLERTQRELRLIELERTRSAGRSVSY